MAHTSPFARLYAERRLIGAKHSAPGKDTPSDRLVTVAGMLGTAMFPARVQRSIEKCRCLLEVRQGTQRTRAGSRSKRERPQSARSSLGQVRSLWDERAALIELATDRPARDD